jgi:hypothetical protein
MNGKAARPHTVFPEATPAPLLTIDEAVCGAAAMQPGEWPPELKQLNRVCLSHGAVVALVTRERTPAVFSGAPAECGVAVLGAMRVQNIAVCCSTPRRLLNLKVRALSSCTDSAEWKSHRTAHRPGRRPN